jgi:NUMOD4 motif
MNEEVWVAIPGYPNYAVSNMGRVANIKRDELLRLRPHDEGYLRVSLSHLGQVRDFYVHRLVASVFLVDYDPRQQVVPVNGDITDCRATNLHLRRQPRFLDEAPSRVRQTSRPVQIIETGDVYRTARTCADYIGGDYGSIYACLRGERRSHMGYTYRYYEEEYGVNAA